MGLDVHAAYLLVFGMPFITLKDVKVKQECENQQSISFAEYFFRRKSKSPGAFSEGSDSLLTAYMIS